MDLIVGALLMVLVALYLIVVKEKYRGADYEILGRAGLAGMGTLVLAFLTQKCLYAMVEPGLAAEAFIYAAATEEGIKFLLLRRYVFSQQRHQTAYDFIKTALVASLVFAGIENLVYVTVYFSPLGLEVAALRMYTVIPMHALCGISMGWFMSKSTSVGDVSYLALVVPWLLHGLYDIFALGGDGAMAFVALLVGTFVHMRAIRTYLS